ncbi:MAG TPA: thermonuclease family protein [Thermodesulfobacteriota bacterium]|nr:thermonuclease family protein [Thermodesulfobacteriota bacterium]
MAGATLLALLAFFGCLLSSSPSAARTLSGRVIKVFDGDSILVRVEGREEHVRLREIDAPEISTRGKPGQEPWGKRAKDFAAARAANRTVRLELDDREERDRYSRILAYVFAGEVFLNRELLASGNAIFYPGQVLGKYATGLEAAERSARDRGIGVWDRRSGLKELPRDFRSRTGRDGLLFAGRAPDSERKALSPETYPVPPGKIVGNSRSRIYHPAGSKWADRVSPRNRVLFDSAEEAEKAGYRRAGERPKVEFGTGNTRLAFAPAPPSC